MPENETQETGTGTEQGTGTATASGPQDAIDDLIDALNDSGVLFVRDTWIDVDNDMGRNDYGVVTLTGQGTTLWGDDRMLMQEITGNVILYVMDGDDAKAEAVQNILREYPLMSFRLRSSEFVRDLIATRWTWEFTLEEYFGWRG